MKHRIIIADDHSMMRNGIRSLIEENSSWSVVGEAASGPEALDLYHALKPDLMILDISMPELNGMEVASKILETHAEASLLILSMYDDEEYIGKCIEMGVKGYIIKSDSGDELTTAIRTVLAGQTFFSKKAQESIFQKYSTLVKKKSSEAKISLTKRELEIIQLIAKGKSSMQIADLLNISMRTVETHRSNLLKKVGVKNSIELIKRAEQLALI